MDATIAGKIVPTDDRQKLSVEFLLISSIIIVVSIAAVEYLIKANNITDINQVLSVGQFIPLMVGIFGFADILFSLWKEKMYQTSICWVLFGHHLS